MIKKRKRRQIELIIIIVIIFVLIAMTYYLSSNDIFSDIEKRQSIIHHVNISIISSYWNLSQFFDNTTNTTVASLLFESVDHFNISVKKDYWPGYESFFITKIGNMTNGMDNRYWQYYVNDIYADKGCSNYYLQDNDSIVWVFEASPWGPGN
jgi:hypothetical protein